MSAPVTLPAIFSGIRSKVDRTYTLTFGTQEMSGEDAAKLLSMQQDLCWLVIAPSEAEADQVEVPQGRPEVGMTAKTPSQRLRAVLFVLWKQLGSRDDFEDYYRTQMERFIEIVKSNLDDGERES